MPLSSSFWKASIVSTATMLDVRSSEALADRGQAEGVLRGAARAEQSATLLLEQAGLDVLQQDAQLLLHLRLGDGQLGTRVPPHRHTLALLQVFGAHLQTDRNPLQQDQRLVCFRVPGLPCGGLEERAATLSSQWLNFHPGE